MADVVSGTSRCAESADGHAMTEANDDRADVSVAAKRWFHRIAALSPQLAARSLASPSHSDQSTQSHRHQPVLPLCLTKISPLYIHFLVL